MFIEELVNDDLIIEGELEQQFANVVHVRLITEHLLHFVNPLFHGQSGIFCRRRRFAVVRCGGGGGGARVRSRSALVVGGGSSSAMNFHFFFFLFGLGFVFF